MGKGENALLQPCVPKWGADKAIPITWDRSMPFSSPLCCPITSRTLAQNGGFVQGLCPAVAQLLSLSLNLCVYVNVSHFFSYAGKLSTYWWYREKNRSSGRDHKVCLTQFPVAKLTHKQHSSSNRGKLRSAHHLGTPGCSKDHFHKF